MRPAALLLALLALTACASADKYGPPRTAWDDDTPVESAAADAPESKPEADERITASDVADQAETAPLCLDIARRHAGPAGLALLRACMQRTDFIDLAGVLQEPWLRHVRASAKLQTRLVEVLAHRGGFLEGDLAIIAKAGVPLFSLSQALAKPGAMRGAQVVIRGTVESVITEKWGKGYGLVATIDETSWLDDDGGDDTPTLGDIERTAVERTGRTIYVRVERRDQLKHGEEVVVLMIFERPRQSTSGAGDQESGIGMFAAAFEASPTLEN